MGTIKNIYNAIETIHGKVFFTDKDISVIFPIINDKENKYLKIGDSIIAINQITEVRNANGPEYFEKFVLPNLSRSIAPKIKSWLSENEKKPPTIEQIQAKIDSYQEDEDKYNQALKEITPEQREARLRQVQETKERIFNK